MTLAAPLPLDVRRAMRSFSGAARNYDAAASLQAETREQLLGQLPADAAPQRLLDLGCGTGLSLQALQARYPGADGWALDLAYGMVAQARARGASGIVADAQALPLAAGSVDLIVSNLVLQWCPRPEAALAACARVLRAGGCLALSIPVNDTLCELRTAWRAVDDAEHVHAFRSDDVLPEAAARLGLLLQGRTLRRHVQRFPSVQALMHNLRAIGAGNASTARRRGLLTAQALRRMEAAYPRLPGSPDIVATWDILYLVVRRS